MIGKKGREWKEKKFKVFEDMVKSSEHFLFFNFAGMDVPAFISLRKKMRELGNQVMVAKNVFIRMLLNLRFEEPIAVIAVKDDPIKTIKELIKVLDKEKIRGSVIARNFYNKEATLELSKAPDSDDLKRMLISNLNGLLWKLVFSLKFHPSALLNILNIKSKEQGG